MDIEATPGTEAQQSLTEEQAVSELLSRWNKPKPGEETSAEEEEPESTGTEEETEEGQQLQSDAPTEEEPEEPEESAGETEIDVAGEKFKVPAAFAEIATRIQAKAKEVEAGSTRKFQEAADLRKAAEVQVQSAKQLHHIAQSQAELLGDHAMVSRRLQQLEGININSIEPDALSRLNAEYNQLTAAKTRIEGQYGQNLRQMQEEESKAIAARREHAEKLLSTHIKGWSADHAKKLSEYALSKGAPADVLRGISDAWMVQILDDAAYGHAMRQAKPQAIKRVEKAPQTLKPGAAGTQKSAGQAKAADAMARAKKTGSVEDAAMAFLARSASRKR